MPTRQLDLSQGALILVRSFNSDKGFEAKDKFLVIIGHLNPSTVLAFRITSQLSYLKTRLSRELVRIPIGTCRTLSKESFVQCFHDVERLDVNDLQAGFVQGRVINRGSLNPFLGKIRDVVEDSDVLSRRDIADCLQSIGKI